MPEIENSEIIVYDTSLVEFLEKDVLNEYKTILTAYKLNRENYDTKVLEILEYEKQINECYLYNPKWKEEDYLSNLKLEKANYAALYGDIRKIENNIQILNKKHNSLNEKIQIQTIKDEKDMQNKRERIDKDIAETQDKLSLNKQKFEEVKIQKKANEEILQDIKEEEDLINEMLQELKNDEFKCKYCNSTIKRVDRKNKILDNLTKKVDKLKAKKEKYDDMYKQNINDFNYYGSKIKELTTELKNSFEFKKNDYNFYIKKSVEVLKLEAQRDKVIKDINKLKKEFSDNSETKSKDFLQIKEKISKLELSLENLQKIKSQKNNFKQNREDINKLKNTLIEQNKLLEKYKKFLVLYFKVYERKINDYFGPDFKFKLFRFKNFDIEEILEVTYKNVLYEELPKYLRQECDRIYKQKISYIY